MGVAVRIAQVPEFLGVTLGVLPLLAYAYGKGDRQRLLRGQPERAEAVPEIFRVGVPPIQKERVAGPGCLQTEGGTLPRGRSFGTRRLTPVARGPGRCHSPSAPPLRAGPAQPRKPDPPAGTSLPYRKGFDSRDLASKS
ncbi:hypothetical protein Ato02nite_033890 [Paractinoplanes toevensis]|uniref:Uncharacterized protein n=1 Tax=Paractinoplanes toevensis TaxID=571911 RepID=A0A919W822_9ACTN|nr:hypothetical protein Ato02nite_033890 [Actinoplanes toevensis]